MIKLSLKELAKFMTSPAAAARRVLRDRKLRTAEGRAQASYYAEARSRIRRYHSQSLPPNWLSTQSLGLAEKAVRFSGPRKTRLLNNARALVQYEARFAERRWKVLPQPRLELRYGAVAVSAVPDLYVEEKGVRRLLKFEFSEDRQDARVFSILSQGLFEAARSEGLDVAPTNVVILDVPRGEPHRGARMKARLAKDIAVACENVEAVWDRIK